MNKFEMRSLVFWRNFLDVLAECWKIKFVPCLVEPGMFCLEIVLAHISAVYMKSKVCVEISIISDFVDGNGNFGGRDVCVDLIGCEQGRECAFVASSSASTFNLASFESVSYVLVASW